MSAKSFEAFLARIYTDAGARAQFLSNPRGAAAAAGLAPEECDALARIDTAGLEFAARSFARKREEKERHRGAARHFRRLLSWLRR
jgi:hypothetical protein